MHSKKPHIIASTPLAKETSEITPRASSIKRCLKRSIKSPLTCQEEKLYTHLIRRKLSFAKDKSIIKCPTRGQVMYIISFIILIV